MRGLTAALMLSSILPDVDIALVPRGFDWYLRAHASGTHSVVGSIIEAGLPPLFPHALARGPRPSMLLPASSIGAAGPIFSAPAEGTATSLLKPFSDAAFG